MIDDLNDGNVLLDIVTVKTVATFLVHPIHYARTLMQLGHEPLPPIESKSFRTGDRIKILPNVFSYIGYIYRVDGLSGCYRGLFSRIALSVTWEVVYFGTLFSNRDRVLTDMERSAILGSIKWDCLAMGVAAFVSHPLFVTANRQMAQFVGRETFYSPGIIYTLYTVAKQEGISAWFSGLAPRFIETITNVFITHYTEYLVNKYMYRLQEFTNLMVVGILHGWVSLTYPFQLVSVCMSVNGSGLQVGSSPAMPDYQGDWVNCLYNLSDSNQMERGARLFRRPYYPKQFSPILSAVLSDGLKYYKMTTEKVREAFEDYIFAIN